MSPDEIRRSWDDDDTPRSVFPEPLAERLTRENKELRAEVERLRDCVNGQKAFMREGPFSPKTSLGRHTNALWHTSRETQARHDALVADLRGLADEWVNGPRPALEWNVPIGETFAKSLRAVLDKHAGEQP